MNLQQLDHFLALAETGSFRRAAEQVHLTQPALTRSIQALEEEVGATLVDRLGRRNELTQAGALVVQRARRIRLEVSELRLSGAKIARLETGTLRLGLGPAPYEMLAAPLLAHVLAKHPGLRLQLSGGPPDLQLQALRSRTLDALVIHKRSIPAWDDLEVQLFPPMRLGFLCRKKHPLLQAGRLGFSKLSAFPVVASGIGLSVEVVQQLNQRFGRQVHFDSLVRFQSDEVACLLETARSTDAVFFGVVQVARRFAEAGHLVELSPARSLGLSSQFAFVTLDGVSEVPALAMVRRFCEEAMREG